MAASASCGFSPSGDNYYYNRGSYHPHGQTPMVPVIGYYQPGYLVYSQAGVPLYPQNQPQPFDFGPSTTASFSGGAESKGYHGFMACSWVLNSQEEEYGPQPYQLDSFPRWAADGNYSQILPQDPSWFLNSQGQPQPYICCYNQNETNHQASVSRRPENSHYQFTACDDSLIVDAIEEEEDKKIVGLEISMLDASRAG